MTDFTSFDMDTGVAEGGHGGAREGAHGGGHEGGHGEHAHEPEHHYSERHSNAGYPVATGLLVNAGHLVPSFIPDELVVLASFLAVFAVCLAAMLPWYYASRGLIKSSNVNTPKVANGLALIGSMTSVDPLTLSVGLAVSTEFVGCTNYGFYTSETVSDHATGRLPGPNSTNNTVPQIDESLDLFYMTSDCLNNMTGQDWALIYGDWFSSSYPFSQPDPLQARTVVVGPPGFGKLYSPFDQAAEGDIHVKLQEVNPYQNYPFDSYTAQAIASVYFYANGTSCPKGGYPVYLDEKEGYQCFTETSFYAATPVNTSDNSYPMPVMISLKSNVVGFTVSFQIVSATTNIQNATSFIIYMDISRSSFTQGLSMFIVVVMWGISLGIAVMTLDATYFRHTKPISLGNAGLCATMLFALPSLRSVQPGIPPTALYASIDIFSFFMNMALIASSLVLLLVKIIAENKVPASRSTDMQLQGSKSLPANLSPRFFQSSQTLAPGSMIRDGPRSQVARSLSKPSEALKPSPSSAAQASTIALNVNSNA
jgi:hypothetical protein